MNEEQPIFVLILPKIKKTDTESLAIIKDVFKAASKDGHYTIALTGSNIEDVKKVLEKEEFNIDIFNSDETPLKTIMRSNPGILVLKKGTILGKYHHNDEMSYKKIKESLDL